MKQIVIGLSGFARVGKDSFYRIASDIIEEKYGLKCKRYALADALKGDIREFILDKVGIDVLTDDPELKSIIRPLLVAYGKCKRIQSNGTYWTSLLQSQIESDTKTQVVFVTDIRYAEYEEDEVQWIKDVMGGTFIHISKYERDSKYTEDVRIYTQAPNEDEAKNDPILRGHADMLFEWEHCLRDDDTVDEDYMRVVVEPVVDYIIMKQGT